MYPGSMKKAIRTSNTINIPDWKVQTNEWNVEDSRAWRTEDTDKFFYEIEEKKKWKYFVLIVDIDAIVLDKVIL